LDDASVARRAPEHKTSSRDNLPVLVLDAEIHTGFRHQIRAHLAWGGFPVLGDSLYGGLAARRLFLESYAIEVEHFDSSSLYFSLYE
jgi:23S rRNA-/tRNA-specific pseudouridylate synthase